MNRRALDRIALAVLPVLAGIALIAPPFGGWVDPCLSPGPGCGVHEAAVPLALVLVPATVLWLLALADLVRSRRR